MQFYPGFDIRLKGNELEFEYGPGVIGPAPPEFRTLDEIRSSLRNPACTGPNPVYGIAMDVAPISDLRVLKERMLLFGAVAYAAGRLGDEPVRSQGHVHAIAQHSNWSPPEWFEIWEGTAIIYAQQRATDNPGICVAVTAEPGEQVVVPPGWAHCVMNANPHQRMVFGALCDREYGFVYKNVRSHHGLAWFPVLNCDDTISWQRNPHYQRSKLIERGVRDYPELGCRSGQGMYQQFLENPDAVQWISDPVRMQHVWSNFLP